MRSSSRSKKLPNKSKDLPATQGLVLAVRDELTSKINEVDRRLSAKMDGLELRLSEKIDVKIDTAMSEMREMFHRAMIRFEQQQSDNRAVLEGYHNLYIRQDRVEQEPRSLNHTIKALAATAPHSSKSSN